MLFALSTSLTTLIYYLEGDIVACLFQTISTVSYHSMSPMQCDAKCEVDYLCETTWRHVSYVPATGPMKQDDTVVKVVASVESDRGRLEWTIVAATPTASMASAAINVRCWQRMTLELRLRLDKRKQEWQKILMRLASVDDWSEEECYTCIQSIVM